MKQSDQRSKPSSTLATLWSGLFFYATYRTWFLYGTPYSWVPVTFAVIAGVNSLTALSGLISFLHNIFLLMEAFGKTVSKGSSAWATSAEIRRAGLYKTDGLFFGCDQTGHPLFYSAESHGLTLAASGYGKTQCFTLPALCKHEGSAIVMDFKGVLAVQVKHLLEKKYGKKVYILNPAGLYEDILGPSDHLNPIEYLIDDWKDESKHPFLIPHTKGFAFQLSPDPKVIGDNQYFINASRRLVVFGMLFLVTHDDCENANLCEVLRLLQNEDRLLDALSIASASELLNGELVDMASDFLKKFEVSDRRQIESIREGAIQAVEHYSPSSMLSKISRKSSFRFKDLKKENAVVFVITDAASGKAMNAWQGEVGFSSITELTMCRNNKPVLYLFDEATNFKIENLPNSLTTMREYGLRAHFVIQELSEWSRVYGKEALDTLLSQTEIKQIFGIQSQKTAELVSQMLGEETLKLPNYNLGHDHNDKVQKSLNESVRRLLTPDEVRRFTDSILFVKNMKPIRAKLIGVHEVKPWSRWLKVNPLHGKKLKGKTHVWLSYFWRFITGRPSVSKYLRIKPQAGKGKPLVYSLQMGLALFRGGLALVPLVAIIITFSLPKTPHVLTYYERYGSYSACTYFGKNGKVELPSAHDCSVITFIGEESQFDLSSYMRSISSIFN